MMFSGKEHVLRLLVLLTLLGRAAVSPALEGSCGFDGHIKDDCWFPIWLDPYPGADTFDVSVIAQNNYGSPREKVVFRAMGYFPADPGARGLASCKWPSGAEYIRCEVAKPDGTKSTAVIHPRKISSSSDIFTLVITDRPENFQFMGSLGNRSGTGFRPITAEPRFMPEQWYNLQCIDVIILDSSEQHSFSVAQKKAVSEWLTAGGTIILTHNAITAGEQATWNFFDECTASGKKKNIPAPELACMLDKYSNYVTTVSSIRLATPRENKILWSGNDVLVAAKDVGLGRVIALGFDWQDLNITDHVVHESVRNAIWKLVLSLAREAGDNPISEDMVTPREARAKYLVWYVVGFLAVYVLVLSLLNWLVLRGARRMEYSAATLPAGALVFAVCAFGIGLWLRGSQTIVFESQLFYSHHSDAATVRGTTGILSPSREPYRLSAGETGVVIDKPERSYWCGGMQTDKILPVYALGRKSEISNVKIGIWTMDYFATKAIYLSDGGLECRASFTTNGLSGKIVSRLPFDLEDAWLIYRWNKINLGNIKAGSDNEFILPVTEPPERIFNICPNCHRCHGPKLHGAGEKEKEPLPKELEDFLSEARLFFPSRPHLIAWQKLETATINVNRDNVQHVNRRFCSFPTDILAVNGAIEIPMAGIPGESADEPSDIGRPAAYVENIRFQTTGPIRDVVAEVLGSNEEEDEDYRNWSSRRRSGGRKANLKLFYLPGFVEEIETAELKILWHAGLKDEDEGEIMTPADLVLSAYSWEQKSWEEISSAAYDKREITIENPGRFLLAPPGALILKVEPKFLRKDEYFYDRTLYLEFSLKGTVKSGGSSE